MLNRKLLSIYLNDHLAGSTIGLELAGRAERQRTEVWELRRRAAREAPSTL
jgi:hypothetical protein